MPDSPELIINEEALALLKTWNGANQLENQEKHTALQALAYCLGRNYRAAAEGAKDGVFTLSFRVKFDRNEVPTAIKAVSRCSTVSTADIDLTCPFPDDEDDASAEGQANESTPSLF